MPRDLARRLDVLASAAVHARDVLDEPLVRARPAAGF
jgi:hypothetical protein